MPSRALNDWAGASTDAATSDLASSPTLLSDAASDAGSFDDGDTAKSASTSLSNLPSKGMKENKKRRFVEIESTETAPPKRSKIEEKKAVYLVLLCFLVSKVLTQCIAHRKQPSSTKRVARLT